MTYDFDREMGIEERLEAHEILCGSRQKPLEFQTTDEAREYSRKQGAMIWAKVWSWTGVWQIYPGGRTIHYR